MKNINYQLLQKFLKNKDIQKHINYLSNKYNGKKILLYGSGLLADLIFSNYDLSSLNIIGIADNKYSHNKETYKNLKTYSPQEIPELDFDVIIILINDFLKIKFFIKQKYPFKTNLNIEHILPHNFYEKFKFFILEKMGISGVSNSF